MSVILSMKDRVKLKVGKVTFILKPLSILEQNKISSFKKMVSGEEVQDVTLTSFHYVKMALKEIKGVKTHNKKPYQLEFEGDYLTDDCASEIFSMSLGAEFIHALQSLRYNDISGNYFGTNDKLKGVKLEVISNGEEKS